MGTYADLPNQRVELTGALKDCAVFECGAFDAVALDIENEGGAAFTAWKLFARVARDAPWRDVTPASLTTADGYLVLAPSPRAVSTLAAGSWTHLMLNVSLYDAIKLQFSGAGAIAKVNVGGVS